jgi:hypothetical protein
VGRSSLTLVVALTVGTVVASPEVALGQVVVTEQEAAAGPEVTEGDSVRVVREGAISIEGIAVLIQGERISLRTDGVVALWPVSLSEMHSLDVLRPRTKSEGFRYGLGTGLAGGLFIGAAVGLVLYLTGAVGSADDPQAELLMQTTLRGSWIGSLVVGIIGGFRGGADPGYGWRAVELDSGR